MSTLSESRIFYNWRVTKHGWPYLVASLVTAMAAGAFAGLSRASGQPAPFGLTRTEELAGFIALALVTGLLWWKFSSLQDEMFHRIQNYSYGWGAAVTVAILAVWGIANAAALAPPIDPLAPFFLFAIIKAGFWTVATRKWL